MSDYGDTLMKVLAGSSVLNLRQVALGQAPQQSLAEFLRQKGPLVDVQIGPPAGFKSQGARPGNTLKALIDTGASISAIDNSAAASLGLVQTGSAQIGGVGGLGQQPVYGASLRFLDPALRVYDPITLVGASLGVPDFQVLIGRNILKDIFFDYAGPEGSFALTAGAGGEAPAMTPEVGTEAAPEGMGILPYLVLGGAAVALAAVLGVFGGGEPERKPRRRRPAPERPMFAPSPFRA